MFSFHANLVFHLSLLVVVILRAEKKGNSEVSILCLASYRKHFALSKIFTLFTSKIPQS